MFITCLIAFFIALVISAFDPTGYVVYAVVVTGAGAVMASIVDTWMSFKEFELNIKNTEKAHKLREMEIYGDLTKPCFDAVDKKEIRRRRFSYIVLIGIKTVLIVILVALVL